MQSFYSLVDCCLVIVWDFISIQLDCLLEKKCREIFAPHFGFLVLHPANPRAKRTGLDSIPCSPITWIVIEPARYNKSRVLFGVGWLGAATCLSVLPAPLYQKKGKKKTQKPVFPQISLAVTYKTRLLKWVASLLINWTNYNNNNNKK